LKPLKSLSIQRLFSLSPFIDSCYIRAPTLLGPDSASIYTFIQEGL
jgi:hypothetical protein